MQLKLNDEDVAVEAVIGRLNLELAGLQVRVIRHYPSPRAGSRTWYLIFRNVSADNWDRLRAGIDRVLRNVDCAYAVKPPTIRR